MGIPEPQLDTWSHQGSIQQSAATYQTIKGALEAYGTPYAGKDFKVFLQGSYGNDTNIYAESDVDIVIRMDDCFHHDLTRLPVDQQVAFKEAHSDATYSGADFKRDALSVLSATYGTDVALGDKAIAIAKNGNRRKSDVVVAIQFRRYHKFNSVADQSFDSGICFYTKEGTQIVNYPRQHSENLTAKHQATSSRFKPMVRVLKNLRSRLVADGLLNDGDAPSYYLEGLLYNVPNSNFVASKQTTLLNVLNFLVNADRSEFVCANEQYYLLRENSPVTWRAAKCDAFVKAAVKLWNEW